MSKIPKKQKGDEKGVKDDVTLLDVTSEEFTKAGETIDIVKLMGIHKVEQIDQGIIKAFMVSGKKLKERIAKKEKEVIGIGTVHVYKIKTEKGSIGDRDLTFARFSAICAIHNGNDTVPSLAKGMEIDSKDNVVTKKFEKMRQMVASGFHYIGKVIEQSKRQGKPIGNYSYEQGDWGAFTAMCLAIDYAAYIREMQSRISEAEGGLYDYESDAGYEEQMMSFKHYSEKPVQPNTFQAMVRNLGFIDETAITNIFKDEDYKMFKAFQDITFEMPNEIAKRGNRVLGAILQGAKGK